MQSTPHLVFLYAMRMMVGMERSSFGTNLRRERLRYGATHNTEYSQSDLRDDLLAAGIPRRYVPSVAKISRWETGTTSGTKVDALVVVGIAKVLDVPVSKLSQEVAAELDAWRDLLEHASPCITA